MMIPPCRRSARWWLTAGWLWSSSPQRPPTCRSPSESMVMTRSRVGSLTCLSRIAARWARLRDFSASPLALAAFVAAFVTVVVFVTVAILVSNDLVRQTLTRSNSVLVLNSLTITVYYHDLLEHH